MAGDEMDTTWRGMKRWHWVIIVVVALAIALVTLLWLDAAGAGDPRLCGQGHACEAASSLPADD